MSRHLAKKYTVGKNAARKLAEIELKGNKICVMMKKGKTEERTAKEMTEKNTRTLNIALLGFGTVGGGVYKLIERQQDKLPDKVGCHLNVKKILVRDRNKIRPGVDSALFTDDFQEIVRDKDIDIVAELMGGIHPAKEYVLEALAAGKHVVTANKDLIAAHGEEILQAAEEKRLDVLFEASVAGGIPVLKALTNSLAGNDIEEIVGIVNGTTNYILTKMTREGMEFSGALAEATRLGYAEADPTADIEGYDAARKCAILSTLAFHSRVTAGEVVTEGISGVTAADIRCAGELGYVIKLLAIAKESDGRISSSVYPALVPVSHPLASVDDSFNAVMIRGDAVGDTMFYGRGAGELPTASAALGDLMEVSADILRGSCGRTGRVCFRALPLKSREELSSCFFVRLEVQDTPDVPVSVEKVFGMNQIGLRQLRQNHIGGQTAELALVTEKVSQQAFDRALNRLAESERNVKVLNVIRVYGVE